MKKQLSGNTIAILVLGGSFVLGCLGTYLAFHYDTLEWAMLWIFFFVLLMAG